MKKLMFLAFATFAVSAAMAFPSPKISAIQIESTKGPKARLTVNYTLSEPAIVLCDIVTNVTGTAEGDDFASIGPEHQLTFSGDVGHKVEAGSGKSFVWYAGADWPSNKLDEATMRVRLTAYPTNRPPDYLVVDLAKDAKERHRYYASAADIPGFPESDVSSYAEAGDEACPHEEYSVDDGGDFGRAGLCRLGGAAYGQIPFKLLDGGF
jgi:hypothetical protein